MLTQLRLFPRAVIPIALVKELPDKGALKAARALKRKVAREEKAREEALKLLQLPLFLPANAEDRSSVEALVVDTGPDAVGIGTEHEEPVSWVSPEILRLHSVLLEQSLKALAARGNPSEKLEILKWIFESDYVAETVIQTPSGPRKTVIFNDQCPFSFAFCCKLEGHDPSFYRQFLRRQMPEAVSLFLAI